MRVVPSLTSFILVFLSLAWGTTAQAKEIETRELLDLLGYDTFLAGMSETLGQADDQIGGGDSAMALAWDMAAAETFQPGDMYEEISSAMDGRLEPAELEGAKTFLASPLGLRITALEEAAQAPGQSEILRREGQVILQRLIAEDAPRLDAYTRLIEALGAIESEVASAMNLNFAIYAGMSQSGRLPYELSESEILELVLSQQDMLRGLIQDQIYISFAYTYDDLSDEELDRYEGFLTSDAGQAVYNALQVVTEDVVGRRARLFGQRLVDFQGVQDL